MKIYSYLDSGRPVVATRLGTHTEVLDDSVAKLVAPDPESMAAGILELLADPEMCEALSSNARLRVEQEYSSAIFQRKLLNFYQLVEKTIQVESKQTAGDEFTAIEVDQTPFQDEAFEH
jgi:glycosyltransferase involved in cell wall biosynthesis